MVQATRLTIVATIAFISFVEARQGGLLKARIFGGGRRNTNKSAYRVFQPLNTHADNDETTISTTSQSVYDSYQQQAPITIESTTIKRATPAPRHPINNKDIATDVADLAHDFERALVAVNKNQNDLHVGNLLKACKRLESSMRQIGFTQSANDIASNVQKVQKVYNQLPAKNSNRDSISTIVEYEYQSGINDRSSGKIKDKSATMGLLWLGRSINYQYDMFQHMLSKEKATPYEAASHAYSKDLKPHLSWPLQKVCQAAMKRMKSTRKTELFSKIGGFSEDRYGSQEHNATQRDLQKLVNSSWKPMLSKWKQIFHELELEI